MRRYRAHRSWPLWLGGLLALGTGTVVARLFAKPLPQSGESARGRFRSAPDPQALREGWEVHDLSARNLAFILLGMMGTAAGLIGIVFLMLWLFTSWDASEQRGLTREETATIVPPPPRLQYHAVEELEQQTIRETQLLDDYYWTDAAHRTAHVPIARGMAMVVGRTLDALP